MGNAYQRKKGKITFKTVSSNYFSKVSLVHF